MSDESPSLKRALRDHAKALGKWRENHERRVEEQQIVPCEEQNAQYERDELLEREAFNRY